MRIADNTVQMFVWVMYVFDSLTYCNALTLLSLSTEGCLVDIAASVPLIRPLFTSSSTSSTKNTYEMRSYSHKKRASTSRGFSGLSTNNTMKLSDGASEEDILPMEGPRQNDGIILKETSYEVEYDIEKQHRGHVGAYSSEGSNYFLH